MKLTIELDITSFMSDHQRGIVTVDAGEGESRTICIASAEDIELLWSMLLCGVEYVIDEEARRDE